MKRGTLRHYCRPLTGQDKNSQKYITGTIFVKYSFRTNKYPAWLRWISSGRKHSKEKKGRIRWHSKLFCHHGTYDIPVCSPSPTSNKHAKPFKSITPPTGDAFIVADISVRKRFDSTKRGHRAGKTNSSRRVRGSRRREDIARSGAEERESACWREQGLKIAWDNTDTARLLTRAAKKMHAATGKSKHA